MDWNRVAGSWKQLEGKVKAKWGLLTDDDLTTIKGSRELLEGKIQERPVRCPSPIVLADHRPSPAMEPKGSRQRRVNSVGYHVSGSAVRPKRVSKSAMASNGR
jgi:uncharacterized protein YjbJ (UPF0337 family)